jgi:hypothetical protein
MKAIQNIFFATSGNKKRRATSQYIEEPFPTLFNSPGTRVLRVVQGRAGAETLRPSHFLVDYFSSVVRDEKPSYWWEKRMGIRPR